MLSSIKTEDNSLIQIMVSENQLYNGSIISQNSNTNQEIKTK